MSARIYQFPAKRRSCFDCIHFESPLSQCLFYDERVDSELYAAKDCEAFETSADGGSDGPAV